MSSAAYSQPVTQASASYAVGQQQTAQYGPYGNRIQVCLVLALECRHKGSLSCGICVISNWSIKEMIS